MSEILQLFHRYLNFGGEESSIPLIGENIGAAKAHNVFTTSSADYVETSWSRFKLPLVMQRNPHVIQTLRDLHNRHQYAVWVVHNVFPAMSVAVYELANELGVPVVQYLHNYRFGCPGATHFRAGKVCFKCSPANMLPALQHRCWRGSLPATTSMVAALQRFWNKGGYDSIQVFIAISESQKRRHEQMGIPPEMIHVLPHYLDVEELEVSDASGDDVLYLGRLTEEKGLKLLLTAWQKVDTQGRTLHIAGIGVLEGELQGYCETNQVQGVKFHGFVEKEKHQKIYDQCSMVVAPSLWEEPFGMVVLEAWKHGKPILTTNIGSFPDLIEHGVDGWLAPVDEAGFTEALTESLKGDHPTMGRRGFEKLKRHYNSKQWYARWKGIAESLMGESRHG
ncbi:glycosyltransferase family 4 protein [Rubritalea marina]|uniref:glycosyltransferase family 4 protein n=1 Tax=Rubritalea marina TaxID=361055 RepID=UPI00037A25A3|nr:glycosyltransferase family 4 protein [Rubritalea marina]